MSRRRQRGPGGGAIAAVAMFAVACGLVLVLAQTRRGGVEQPAAATAPAAATSAQDRVMKSLEHARRARRALGDGNYGDAREHLAQVEATLTEMLAASPHDDLDVAVVNP